MSKPLSLSQKIKAIIKEKGEAEAASLLEVSQRSLYNYSNDVTEPFKRTQKKIAEVYEQVCGKVSHETSKADPDQKPESKDAIIQHLLKNNDRLLDQHDKILDMHDRVVISNQNLVGYFTNSDASEDIYTWDEMQVCFDKVSREMAGKTVENDHQKFFAYLMDEMEKARKRHQKGKSSEKKSTLHVAKE